MDLISFGSWFHHKGPMWLKDLAANVDLCTPWYNQSFLPSIVIEDPVWHQGDVSIDFVDMLELHHLYTCAPMSEF